MFRRLVINLVLAFIIFPAVLLFFGYFRRYIIQDYSGFSGDFLGFTEGTLMDFFHGISFWMLLGVLLPYNTVVYYYKKLKEKEIRFIPKILIFLFIEVSTLMVVGLFDYFFISISLTLQLVLVFLLVSIILVSLHNYFIEKKEAGCDQTD